MNDVLNSIPGGVLIFNDAGIILFVNKTLKKWLGYSEEDIEGKNVEFILTVASRIFYNTHFFPLIKLHDKADEIFLTLQCRDKSDIPVLSNSVRKAEGESFINITVFMPVLQRRKYEDEILQAKKAAEQALKENKELEELTRILEIKTRELDRQYQRTLAVNQDILQFSKIVSHDLQEPIRKIKLFSSILSASENNSHSERRRSAIRKIDSSADRLSLLTSGLQQYVAVDLEGSYSSVNLNDVVASARSKVAEVRKFNEFQIISETLPTIEGYPAQLELLFYHLLDNAIKFRTHGMELIIQIRSTLLEENIYRSIKDKYQFVEHVRIIISDNGVGFDDQYRDYVFDLVKKIDTGTKGIGIGLSIVKKIIDNHNGSIQIQSESNKGTSVILVFPLKVK
jgi:sigma-B regulation protein RsbU (phosphoserine phosphatase)